MPYKKDDLIIKSDELDEQIRARLIFEDLKEKAIKNAQLSEQEKDFFCMGVVLSKLSDGVIEDYDCCENYKFKYCYLMHFLDLTGGTTYYKPQGTDIVKMEVDEAQRNLRYLYLQSDIWETIVMKTNHSEVLLQECTSEARKELKALNSLPEFNTIGGPTKGSQLFKFRKIGLLLQSKYIYCIALEILEEMSPTDGELKINSTEIIFNEYSLIHILNRHYSEITKQYNTNKSFHNEDFKPRILSLQLKEIFKKIDENGAFTGKSINKIGFIYNGENYMVWTNTRTKSVKGQGNINYQRLETFYPLKDVSELNVLKSSSDLIMIDSSLSVYVPK